MFLERDLIEHLVEATINLALIGFLWSLGIQCICGRQRCSLSNLLILNFLLRSDTFLFIISSVVSSLTMLYVPDEV